MMEPKLGRVQAAVLRALARHGYWYGDGFGCGWLWSTPKKTERILESLVRHGFVVKSEERTLEAGQRWNSTVSRKHTMYRPTDAGRAWLEAEKGSTHGEHKTG